MDDDDPEHSERSAEKRLDLALRELGKLMDGALGQVQQMIDDEVDLDPGEIERLFEALRLNTLEIMRALASLEGDVQRERLKLQANNFEEQKEMMRKAASVAMRNKEVEMAAANNKALGDQAKMLMKGGDELMVELTQTTAQLRKDLAEEIDEKRSLKARVDLLTQANADAEKAKQTANRGWTKAEASLEKTVNELTATREDNISLRERLEQLASAATAAAAAQAAADKAQAKADKQSAMAIATVEKAQGQLKDAWAEQARLSQELEASRAKTLEIQSAGEQKAQMLTSALSQVTMDKKAAEEDLVISQGEVQTLSRAVETVTTKLDTAHDKVVSLGAEMREKRQELHKAQKEVDELTTKCHTVEQQKAELTLQHAHTRAEVSRLRSTTASAAWDEVDRLSAELQQTQEAIERITASVESKSKEMADTVLSALRQLGNHLTYSLAGARRDGSAALTILSLSRTHSLPAISPRHEKLKLVPKKHWAMAEDILAPPERRSDMLMRVEAAVARRSASSGLLDEDVFDQAITFAEAMTTNAMSRCKRLNGPGSMVRTASRGGMASRAGTESRSGVESRGGLVSRGAMSRSTLASRGGESLNEVVDHPSFAS